MACCNSSKTLPPKRSSKPRDEQKALPSNSTADVSQLADLHVLLIQERFCHLRRAARWMGDAARCRPRLLAFATLLVFKLAAAAFRVFRTAALLPLASLLPSRSTTWAALLRARTFCAALAFAAMVPSADPIDSAKLVRSAASLVRLRACAFICWLLFILGRPCLTANGASSTPDLLMPNFARSRLLWPGCTRCRRPQSRPALGPLPDPRPPPDPATAPPTLTLLPTPSSLSAL